VTKKKTKRGSGALLGLGLDNEDGHRRITTGKQFAIYGGSAETHEQRGKHLDEVRPVELADIIKNSSPR